MSIEKEDTAVCPVCMGHGVPSEYLQEMFQDDYGKCEVCEGTGTVEYCGVKGWTCFCGEETQNVEQHYRHHHKTKVGECPDCGMRTWLFPDGTALCLCHEDGESIDDYVKAITAGHDIPVQSM